MMAENWFSAPAPIAQRARAYFAPVNRATKTPVVFDASQQGAFDLGSPPAPWIDLGPIQGLTRSAGSKSVSMMAGVPAAALEQARETLEAQVSFEFLNWTKLTMALATGSQHMNLLAPASGAVAACNGAQAVPAVALQAGSTANVLQLAAADAASFDPGSLIAVDADYTGQTGFVGSPISGAYLRQPLSDVDYIRRITFNVALVSQVAGAALTLAQQLPGGVPAPGSRVQAITGFVDREGGTFCQEWSALFVVAGTQGERIFFHYPRLQSIAGAEEAAQPVGGKREGGLAQSLLKGRFLALPVTDPLDGERVLCYRTFLPAPRALI
jgi:hypothetical protein